MELTLNWEWSARQAEALNEPEQFLLYGGAKGGGKSVFLCRWAVLKCAQFRGNKGFLGRKRSVDFNATTLETFKKFIDPKLYRINKQEKRIYLPAFDGVIDYGGLDDEKDVEKFNSAEYGFFGLDQSEEVHQHAFAMLRGTLRHKLPDGTEPDYHARLTANPDQCWLKNDFILNPLKNFKFIKALPNDNPFLAKSYVDNLKEAFKYRPQLLAAYLEGSWDDLEGHDICIQHSWVESARRRTPYGSVLKRIVINDPARFGDDENVIYVMEQTASGHIYITEEIYLEHKSTMDTAGRLASLRKRVQANAIYLDVIGIGAGVYDALHDLEEPVHAINSSSKPDVLTNEERYFNLRSQIIMEGAKKFAEGYCCLGQDPILAGQLASSKFKFQNGKIRVEAKEDIKARLGRSPDRADAYLMGIYAIEKADRLDQAEFDAANEDHVGQGTPVMPEVGETIFAG